MGNGLNIDKAETNTTIANYVKKCSQDRKIAAPLFDFNKNGKFDSEESKLFNQCSVKQNDKMITINLNNEEKTQIQVKFNSEKDLANLKIGRPKLIVPFLYGGLEVRDENMCRVTAEDSIKDISLDYTTSTVQVNGDNTNGYNIQIAAENCDIKNTKLSFIHLKKSVKNANIENVKTYSYSIGPISVTTESDKVHISGKNTNMTIDNLYKAE